MELLRHSQNTQNTLHTEEIELKQDERKKKATNKVKYRVASDVLCKAQQFIKHIEWIVCTILIIVRVKLICLSPSLSFTWLCKSCCSCCICIVYIRIRTHRLLHDWSWVFSAFDEKILTRGSFIQMRKQPNIVQNKWKIVPMDKLNGCAFSIFQ